MTRPTPFTDEDEHQAVLGMLGGALNAGVVVWLVVWLVVLLWWWI